MNEFFKRIMPLFLGILVFSLVTGETVFTEEENDALACLDELSEKNQVMAAAAWEFVKTSAHSKNPQAVECMSDMMQKMMPHCIENLIPKLENEKKLDFISDSVFIMTRSYTSSLSNKEKIIFGKRIINKINEGLNVKDKMEVK